MASGTDSDDPKETESLGAYQVPPATMKRLAAMLDAIRAANHNPPARGVLLSALIYNASHFDGEHLESEVLAPYRRDHPNEDQPR